MKCKLSHIFKWMTMFSFVGLLMNNQTTEVHAADTTAPVAWGEFITPSDATSGNVTIYLNGSDTESGIKNITLPDNSKVSQPHVIYTVSQNGDYEFIFEDKAGNTSSHIVTISNIDTTKPTLEYLTLQKNLDGKYQVSVKAYDDAGIGSIKIYANGTNQTLKIPDGEDYYFINNLAGGIPSGYIQITDSLGNNTGNINFLDLPTTNYTGQPSTKDISITIDGSGDLNYKLDYKPFVCATKPCVINVYKDTTITAINSSGNKTSINAFKITNINKKTTNFVLKGTRNSSNSTKLSLTWNKSITNGSLACETPEGTKTYAVSGTAKNLDGKNFQYDCIVKGKIGVSDVQSNWVSILSDYEDAVVTTSVTDTMPVKTMTKKVNVYVEKDTLGDFYLLNTGSKNSNNNKVPVPSRISI